MLPNKRTVMVIDDEKDIADILSKYLSDDGYLVNIARDSRGAALEAAKVIPDLIMLDLKMPGKDGFQVKAELNQNPLTANIPVIFLSSSVSIHDKVAGLQLRADDYVTKPFDIRELLARINTALNRRKRYEEISMKDALTGLPNADSLKKELTIAFKMAKRYGHVFTVAFIDIDRFKDVNDKYGHLVGDRVLREVARRMEMSLRKPDVLARYGGDEFCMIMREASHAQAEIALSRLKQRVEESSFEGLNGDGKFPITISVGMVTYSDHFSNEEELMAIADENMYRNKNSAGKNQEKKNAGQDENEIPSSAPKID